jgi:anti-anti-sigma factor
MKVDLEKQGTVAVLVPRDALTESTTPALRDVADSLQRQGGAPRIVVDLTNVPYVDSAGIEGLLSLAGGAATPLQARFASLSETVREALQLTGVIKRLVVYESVEAAVRSYR